MEQVLGWENPNPTKEKVLKLWELKGRDKFLVSQVKVAPQV
jgi:hypothetical protein